MQQTYIVAKQMQAQQTQLYDSNMQTYKLVQSPFDFSFLD